MTDEPVRTFLAAVEADADLRAALERALTDVTKDGDADVAVVRFAREHGHRLGLDDIAPLHEALNRREGTLADDQLDGISGGTEPTKQGRVWRG